MTNTFPYLISGDSYDAEGIKQLVGDDSSILASCTIQSNSIDSFFNPSSFNLNGYGYDGNYYFNGVINSSIPQATWFTEAIDTYRGREAAFPAQGIILVTSSGLSILDTSLNVWMVVVSGIIEAMVQSSSGGLDLTSTLIPNNVDYGNGVITLSYTPSVVLYLDFVRDRAYADTSTNPSVG